MYFVNTNKIAQLMQWSNRRRLDHFDLKHVLRGCFLIGFVKLHFIVYSLSHFSKRFVEPWKVAQKTLRWNVLFFFDAHAVLFCFSPFEWLSLWKVRSNRHALKSMISCDFHATLLFQTGLLSPDSRKKWPGWWWHLLWKDFPQLAEDVELHVSFSM